MASSDRPLRAFHSHKWNPFFFNLNFFFLNLFFDFVSISHFRRLPYRVFPFFLVVSTRWWQKNWKKKLQKNKKKEKQKKSDCGGSSCVPISSLKKKKKRAPTLYTVVDRVLFFGLFFFTFLLFIEFFVFNRRTYQDLFFRMPRARLWVEEAVDPQSTGL